MTGKCFPWIRKISEEEATAGSVLLIASHDNGGQNNKTQSKGFDHDSRFDDLLRCRCGPRSTGRFDVRLPVFPLRELGRLSLAFNGMADRLEEAVEDNVRLKSEREVACLVQARLEDERRAIARELHDTLAQCITGVRALAGAIAQRTSDQPALQQPAQTIVVFHSVWSLIGYWPE